MPERVPAISLAASSGGGWLWNLPKGRCGLAAILVAASSGVALAQAMCPEQPMNQPLDAALRRTVVVTAPDLKQANFSLTRTLNTIIESVPNRKTPSATEAERVALLQSLINTFDSTEAVNPIGGATVKLTPRPNERALVPAKLLDPSDPDGMRPIGLFNRFDLTPSNFSYCGEHRIVYAKGDPVGRTNRFFLIFEAALANPLASDPDTGRREMACRAVARFWDGLKSVSGTDLTGALEQFYYRGLDPVEPGLPTFAPVVHHRHFGLEHGQVRGNLFVTPPLEWNLREWRLAPSSAGGVDFSHVTIKENPIPELYGPKTTDNLDPFRDAFKTAFVDANADSPDLGTFVQQLTSLDRALMNGEPFKGRPPRKDELSASVGMAVPFQFNDFQSVSGPSSEDVPLPRAELGDLGQRIEAKLKDLKLADACKITRAHILNRAGAMSCGGCHQFSSTQEIAPNVRWPAPAVGGFVHITENGDLSPALERELLPARRRNLERALSAPAPAPSASQGVAQARVEGLLQSFNFNAASRQDFLVKAGTLEREVIEARREDKLQPGAFVPVRRAH